MRLKLWVEQWVSVDLTDEELRRVILGPYIKSNNDELISVLSRAVSILRMIDDRTIATLTDAQRGLVAKYLNEQAARYAIDPACRHGEPREEGGK